MTVDELLACLPPFEAATRRNAASAVVGRLPSAGSLVAIVIDALTERDGLRAQLDRGPDPVGDVRTQEARIEGLAREIGRREAEALVAFLAAFSTARSRPAAPETPEFDALAARLARESNWLLARAGWEALDARAQVGWSPPELVVAFGRRLAGDTGGGTPVWTQVAALDFVASVDGARAVALFTRLLVTPVDGPVIDPFVRAAAIRAICRVDPKAARVLLSVALQRDPSEHVRMEIVRGLGALGAVDLLGALLDPARESSPRIRAVAAIAITPLDPRALALVMRGDPDEIPRRIALEQAEPIAHLHPLLAAAIDQLAVGACGAAAPLALLAAEAAERLHHRYGSGNRAVIYAQNATRGLREGGQESTSSVEGHNVDGGEASIGAAALGRALAVLAIDDLGFEARPSGRGHLISRGDRMRRRLWRFLHEARNLAPEKRQGQLHSIGRVPRHPLRAPPGRLAEVTATRVPGERVLVPALGDWGRHLPTVDDLLSRPTEGEAFVFCAFGVARIGYPTGMAARARARWRLITRYAEFAALRLRSLAGGEAVERQAFVEAIRRLGFTLDFWPHRPGAPVEVLDVYRGSGAPMPAGSSVTRVGAGLAIPALDLPWNDLAQRAIDGASSGPVHLSAIAVMALGLFVVRQHEARRRIESARNAIPLSVGGWGTRGKSGTERLKAALFHGLGCEVLAKTTGCEAMFIHAFPGVRAHEIFIYRPHDKATIWEQQHLLEIAARLGVDVFLWECMALRPGYVEILQQHWMRDSVSTLTNTYPDHENIQGPAGIDIPRSMVPFLPRHRHVLTAEQSMLPILRDAATDQSTTLSTVSYRDHALLPADLLARFPYEEHPQNIALVVNLARHLGVSAEVALKEMADHVVPDLGVLKTYPPAVWRGRQLIFSNGMSANERTGFINNWQRLGFDRPAEIGEWVVTLVNNRADRVSRSQVFAQVLAEDAPAHLHVLIGTNLSGLRGYIESAVAGTTAVMKLFHIDEAHLPAVDLNRKALVRADRALKRLRLDQLGPARLAVELQVMLQGRGEESPPWSRALHEVFDEFCARGEAALDQLSAALRPVLAIRIGGFAKAFGDRGREAIDFLAGQLACHIAIRRWQRSLSTCQTPHDRVAAEQAFRDLWAQLFLSRLLILSDPALSGDQIIDAVAHACPPGHRVRIMGAQNIKGTGLDFVYRWIAHERTIATSAALDRLSGPPSLVVAQALAMDGDAGVLDGPVAIAAVQAALSRSADSHGTRILRALLNQLVERQTHLEAALTQAPGRKRGALAAGFVAVADIYKGVVRRRRADAVIEDLTSGKISHARAAKEMRDLIKG